MSEYRNINPQQRGAANRGRDFGPAPFVVNIERAAYLNNNFRTALWTGKHLQITLMSLRPGESIGAEVHPNLDQILCLQQGNGVVVMGNTRNHMSLRRRVGKNDLIVIPAGTWHNLFNTGSTPLKLFSVYAPPAHPRGTVHITKQDAEEAENY